MKQARVPTDVEFKRLMAVVAQGRHAARNRLAFMLSYQAGLRVGEIAALQVQDVADQDRSVRDQLRLSAAITKGGHARNVFLNERLRREIERFLDSSAATPPLPRLYWSRRRTPLSARTPSVS